MTQPETQLSPYSKFFQNEFLSDCTLENLEPAPATYKAHKLVLAANSEFFSKYFQENKLEGQVPKVTLPKFVISSLIDAKHQDVFAKVLEFFYSAQTAADLAKLGLNKENAFAFLNQFSALQVKKGIHLAEEFVQKELVTPKNCAECLFDAVKSDNKPLKEKCVETLVPIFSEMISDSKQKLRFLSLPLEVFKEILSKDNLVVQNENVLLNLVVDYIQMKEALPPKEEPKPAEAPVPENKPAEEKKPEEEKKQEKPKPAEEKKAEEAKPAEQKKPEEPKPAEDKKPEGAKPAEEKKPEEPKPAEKKPEEAKPAEDKKPEEKKPEEPKPAEKKPEEAKPAEDKKPEDKKPEEKKPEEKGKPAEGKKEEGKAEEKKPEAEVKPAEQKKEAAPAQAAPEVKILDLEAEAQARLKLYKLSMDEKRDLVKLLRLTHVSHDALIKAAGMQIFSEFKDIFIETLSAKLNNYETAEHEKYSINLNPRQYTEPLSTGSPSKVLNTPQRQAFAALSKMAHSVGAQQLSQHPQGQGQGHPQGNQKVPYSPERQAPNQGNLRPQGNYSAASPNTGNYPQQQFSSPPRKNQSEVYQTRDHAYERPVESTLHYSQTVGSNIFRPQGPHTQDYVPSRSYQSPEKQGSHLRRSAEKPYQSSKGFGSPPSTSQVMSSNYTSANSGKKEGQHTPNRGQPLVFGYKHDFDENGALFYLGTYGRQNQWQNPHDTGQLQVFFSSLGKGSVADFVGRDCVNCRTLNEPDSFMGIDLGVGRYIIPNCYTIRNRNSNHHVLLNWVLEASVDMKEWFVIDKRTHFTEDAEFNRMTEATREDLKQKGYMSTWGIDENQIEKIRKSYDGGVHRFGGFRFFRITQIDKNSSGSFNLALSGFEVYGVGFGENWIF